MQLITLALPTADDPALCGLPLLQGYRGHPPADLDALRELLLRVSRLAVEVPEIAELDPPCSGSRRTRLTIRGFPADRSAWAGNCHVFRVALDLRRSD